LNIVLHHIKLAQPCDHRTMSVFYDNGAKEAIRSFKQNDITLKYITVQ